MGTFTPLILFWYIYPVFQAYYYEEIIYPRYFKMTWRLVFLLTIVLYAVLIIVNILSYL